MNGMSHHQAEALWAYYRPQRQNARPTEPKLPESLNLQILRAVRTPTNAVPLITAFCLLAALLFPPFYAPLPEGLSNNLGFSFFLNPPRHGFLFGRVDVPLLITELVVILLCGSACWFVAKKL